MIRPIINFVQNPDGVDGQTGAQISGGFATVQEAQDLARILKIGGLPINMILVRQRLLG
jgi:SecD/SecF fusion protein